MVQAVRKPDAEDLESRTTIIAERIKKGDRMLEKAPQVQAAQEKWEAYTGEKSSLERRITLLDGLVEFLGPNGAMMAQASRRIGSFAESLNVHLAVFGYECNLTLDPFEIRVMSTESHCGLHLKQLSDSERFRFSIAFQLALATATGIRFVAIDGADLLDNENRKLLTASLSHSDIDQAIVLATSDEALSSLVPEGVKFLSLSEGMKHRRDKSL